MDTGSIPLMVLGKQNVRGLTLGSYVSVLGQIEVAFQILGNSLKFDLSRAVKIHGFRTPTNIQNASCQRAHIFTRDKKELSTNIIVRI